MSPSWRIISTPPYGRRDSTNRVPQDETQQNAHKGRTNGSREVDFQFDSEKSFRYLYNERMETFKEDHAPSSVAKEKPKTPFKVLERYGIAPLTHNEKLLMGNKPFPDNYQLIQKNTNHN